MKLQTLFFWKALYCQEFSFFSTKNVSILRTLSGRTTYKSFVPSFWGVKTYIMARAKTTARRLSRFPALPIIKTARMTASSGLVVAKSKSQTRRKAEVLSHLTKEVRALERDMIALHPTTPGTSEAPSCAVDDQAEVVSGRRKCLPRAAKKRAPVRD